MFRVFLIFFYLIGYSMAETNLCEKPFYYKGLDCCLEKSQCTKIIDRMNPSFLKLVFNIKSQILAEEFPYGATPNCFWTTWAFYDDEAALNPKTLYEWEFNRVLKSNFVEVNQESLRAGDLVLFRAHVITYPDILQGEQLIVELPFHSALYLGNGVVFQKENSVTDNFSLSTLEKSFLGYKNGFLDSQEGRLEKAFYRKINFP